MARLAAGVPVAAILPLCLPRLRRTPVAAVALAAALAALVAIPSLPHSGAWLALVAPPGIVAMTMKRRPASKTDPVPNTPLLRDGLAIALPALAATIACLALAGPGEAWRAIKGAVESNGVIVVSSGALAAVFIGGPLVAWVLSPFAKALDRNPSESAHSLKQAGTLIGWFERALFFAFIVGGQPQAAAVALAAKSFARFPSLSEHREGFAEYFLIGTLASLVIALGAAVAVRAALGQSAF